MDWAISELISLLWVNYRYYLNNDIDYSLYNDRTYISIPLFFFSYSYVSWLLNSMYNFELCTMWCHLKYIIFCGEIHFASIYENVKGYFLSLEWLERDKEIAQSVNAIHQYIACRKRSVFDSFKRCS